MRLDGYDLYRSEKKTAIRNLFCSYFEKKITDIIFKVPIGPAQSQQHSIPEKTHCKKKLLQYYCASFGQVNVKLESRNK